MIDKINPISIQTFSLKSHLKAQTGNTTVNYSQGDSMRRILKTNKIQT